MIILSFKMACFILFQSRLESHIGWELCLQIYSTVVRSAYVTAYVCLQATPLPLKFWAVITGEHPNGQYYTAAT